MHTSLNHHKAAWAQRQAHFAALAASIGMRADGRPADELEDELASIRSQQDRLVARSNELLARADTEGRELTTDERRAIQRRSGEVESLELDAERIEAQLSRPQPRRAASNSGEPQGSSGSQLSTSGGPMRAVGRSFIATPARSFGEMFASAPARDPYAGRFQSFGEFALAVASGNDSRLMRVSASSGGMGSTVGDGASAGFMVPAVFVQRLLDQALLQEAFRPRANVVPITSGDAIIAGFESTDRTGGKRGGLLLEWGAEAQDLLIQKPKARKVQAAARKANVYCVVSSELAEDAPNFDQALSQAMIAAVAGGLDYAFMSGTGAGTPLGIINAPATIEVAKESGQAANTLLLQNLAKMVGRLDPASFVRSVWFVHPTLVPQLYMMSYTVKNVAGTENVGGSFVPAVSHDADGNLVIFGRPAVVTDACSALSAKGDIVLADPMRYLIAMRSDMRLVRDTSRYFDSDEIAFRLTLRLDGMPQDSEPTKLRDGTNTVSPFVTLGAR